MTGRDKEYYKPHFHNGGIWASTKGAVKETYAGHPSRICKYYVGFVGNILVFNSANVESTYVTNVNSTSKMSPRIQDMSTKAIRRTFNVTGMLSQCRINAVSVSKNGRENIKLTWNTYLRGNAHNSDFPFP